MKDLISRQEVLKLLHALPPEEAMTKAMLVQSVKQMDVAQPEKRTDKRTETHACDCISRQAAIDYFVTNVGFHDEDENPIEDSDELRKIWTEYFDGIPSAQPEIIRCRDCVWHDVNVCRNQNSIPWKDDDFCSMAERREVSE